MTEPPPIADRSSSGDCTAAGVTVDRVRGASDGRERLAPAARLLAVALAAVAAFLLVAQPAQAHAALIRSTPAPDAKLERAPSSLELWFSEPIEPEFSRLELFAGDGKRIDLADLDADVAEATRMAAALPALEPGVYTVVYRTLSRTDAHFTAGSYRFTVLGAGGQAVAGAAFEPRLDGGTGPLATLGRWLALVGLVALVGGAAVAFAAIASDRSNEGLARPLAQRSYLRVAVGALAFAVAGDAMLLMAQHDAAGGSITTLLLESRFGTFWLTRQLAMATVAAVVGLALLGRGPRSVLPVAAVAGGLVALYTITMVSHAAGAPGRFWAFSADFVHLATAALWLGGVAFLALLALQTRAAGERVERATVLRFVSWFSIAAAASVYLLAATGLVRALGELPSLDALTATNYSRWLLAKLALTTPVLGVALLNRRVVRRWSEGETSAEQALARLRALLPAEALLGVAVLFSVAALGQASTPRADAAPAGLGDGRFASPAPQLSTGALLGGALAVAAAGVVLGTRFAGAQGRRGNWVEAGATTAVGADVLIGVIAGLSDLPATAAVEPATVADTAPAPAAGADCALLERGANLSGCDLSGRDLRGVDLREANLTGANLAGANLFGAHLEDATMLGANLRGADLTASYLSGAILSGADLRDANLRGANAVGALLGEAKLAGANLTGADLAHAFLAGADLDGAVLAETTLTDADLTGVNWTNTSCPQGPRAIPGGVELCRSD